MTNEIVARAINDLQRIGLPGSAERLQSYIAELEKKASAVQPLDREQWRYKFAGQAMQGLVSRDSCNDIPEHIVRIAVIHAYALLDELEQTR